MKTLAFALFMIVCQLAFSQEEITRGTIRIKNTIPDTTCVATLLGYNGTNYITKEELLSAKIVELTQGCNCEILTFRLAYIKEGKYRFALSVKGNVIDKTFFNKDIGKITNFKIDNIVSKNKTTGEEITLPKIIFNVID